MVFIKALFSFVCLFATLCTDDLLVLCGPRYLKELSLPASNFVVGLQIPIKK